MKLCVIQVLDLVSVNVHVACMWMWLSLLHGCMMICYLSMWTLYWVCHLCWNSLQLATKWGWLKTALSEALGTRFDVPTWNITRAYIIKWEALNGYSYTSKFSGINVRIMCACRQYRQLTTHGNTIACFTDRSSNLRLHEIYSIY